MRAKLIILILVSGCDDALFAECEPGWVLSAGTCTFSESEVRDVIRTGQYATFVAINSAPFTQTFGTLYERNVWVAPTPLDDGSGTAADRYASLTPADILEAELDLPVGTIIVHESVNGEEGHGIRVKREPGFLGPEGHDWWFGKVYDDGTVDNVPCQPCADCHGELVRPFADGLIGVPPEAR